jgi:hypothetical protein
MLCHQRFLSLIIELVKLLRWIPSMAYFPPRPCLSSSRLVLSLLATPQEAGIEGSLGLSVPISTGPIACTCLSITTSSCPPFSSRILKFYSPLTRLSPFQRTSSRLHSLLIHLPFIDLKVFFFFWFSWGRVTLSPLGASATIWPIVPDPGGTVSGIKIGRGTGVLGENLPQCQFVHHKFYMTWPGLEPRLPRWIAGD